MKIKSFLIGAAAALIMCTSVFAANPVLSIGSADYDIYGYSIEDSTGNRRSTAPNADSIVLLFINGNFILEAEPVIKNGTTLVPLRIISDKLGASVSWDGLTKTAIITQGIKTVTAAVGNSYITVDGSTVSTTAPTQIINSSTYVPLRAIASAFGAEVGYDAGSFSSTDYYRIQTVWVQSRTDSPVLTEAEAVQKAEKVLSDFYASNGETSTRTDYNCRFAADLGEYYYIKYYDYSVAGVLIDKYDGSYYPVGSVSLNILEIHDEGDDSVWHFELLQ